MARDYRGKENLPGIDREITNGDMADIEASDVIVANCPTPSYGTAMEIFYASYALGKTVITVCPNPRPSPWLTRFSYRVVPTLFGAFSVLRELLQTGYMPERVWNIYLAGPINACTDSECRDWREEFKCNARVL